MSLETTWVAAASILTVTGVLGNSMVLFVSTRPKFRNLSIFRYLTASMINDFFIIITMWFYATPDFFLINSVTYSCKLAQYFGYLFYQYSPLIITIASIDRILSIKYPNKIKFCTELKYQILALLVALILLAPLDLLYYTFYEITYDGNNLTLCRISSEYMHVCIDLINMVLLIIEFMIMIISTIIVSRHLVKKKTILGKNVKFKKEKRCIKILIVMNSFYVICNLPYCLFRITQDIFLLNNIEFQFNYIILQGATFILIYIQNTFSFFLYFFCNNVFREYCLSILFSKKKISK